MELSTTVLTVHVLAGRHAHCLLLDNLQALDGKRAATYIINLMCLHTFKSDQMEKGDCLLFVASLHDFGSNHHSIDIM